MITNMFIAYLVLVNLAAFLAMGWDKFQAKRSGWRVPEKTLLGLAVIGGGIGEFFGMRLFRHKTKHLQFSLGVPAIIICQLAALWWLGTGSA